MPLYVHSYLRPDTTDPARLVLVRDRRGMFVAIVGLAAAAVGFGVATSAAEDGSYRFMFGLGCVIVTITLIAMIAIARAERIVFDREARTVTLANGETIPFAAVTQLVVLMSKDSDSDDAYGLGVQTATGTTPLSSTWCWNEARVRAVAAAIVTAFPGLVLSTDIRRFD